MASLKEIRRRIGSVSNTKQITRAMKLVSAAKLRRAQDGAINGRSYSNRLRGIISTLLGELPGDFHHPLLDVREEVKSRRVIVISGERGLCGAYNANVLKAIDATEAKEADVNLSFVAIGGRTVSAGKRAGWNMIESHERLSENATEWPVADIANEAIEAFSSGKCDEVVIYYTKFVTAMTQVVTREVLLPVSKESLKSEDSDVEIDENVKAPKTDPSPNILLSNLIPLIVTATIRQAGLESKASEHAARMTAMDSATKNADELTDKLTLYYNRARQSAITTELIDIVGGAEAVS